MITLETLRDSLLLADSYDGIDRLIRAELAAGRTAQAIHEELLPLVKPTRKTPGFTEDADEALLGALDALTGNCHPDCQYRDSVLTPPTKHELSVSGMNGSPRSTTVDSSASERT